MNHKKPICRRDFCAVSGDNGVDRAGKRPLQRVSDGIGFVCGNAGIETFRVKIVVSDLVPCCGKGRARPFRDRMTEAIRPGVCEDGQDLHGSLVMHVAGSL